MITSILLILACFGVAFAVGTIELAQKIVRGPAQLLVMAHDGLNKFHTPISVPATRRDHIIDAAQIILIKTGSILAIIHNGLNQLYPPCERLFKAIETRLEASINQQ